MYKINLRTAGKAGNSVPRGQVPASRASRPCPTSTELGKPQAVRAEGGCPTRPWCSGKARDGREGAEQTDGGKDRETGRDGTAGGSSRVTSVAAADGFSVNPTTKLTTCNDFRFHTAP